MTSTLTFVVYYEVLRLSTFFVGFCWCHAMYKCCQYAIDDSKVCTCLLSISIKQALLFCKKPSLGPRKVTRDDKNGTKDVS
jgi:hypothetical protein